MSFHKTMSTELAFFHVLFPQYVNSDVQNNYSTLTIEELLFFLSRNIYEIMRFKKRRKKKKLSVISLALRLKDSLSTIKLHYIL